MISFSLTLSFYCIVAAGLLFLLWGSWIVWQMRKGGSPFWPSSRKKVAVMLELADIQNGDCVADLGSGDGRLIFAAAERGARRAVGYEIDAFWHRVSEKRKQTSPFAENIQFIKQSFWDADLSGFNVIFLYQGRHVVGDVAKKLSHELSPGARIISNDFALPDWSAKKSSENVFLYLVEKEGVFSKTLSA